MQKNGKNISGLLALGLMMAAGTQPGYTADQESATAAMEKVDAGGHLTDEVVVTAPREAEPLTVRSDPKQPRQPMPAHDGADYLKSIPGFSVIRKGGADGDPVFRGMAGSRLNILLDGETILGGCPQRMDPPTAYIYPGAYDELTVLKGPQTVAYGPGNSAGVVLFERKPARFEEAGMKVNSTLTVGSFGRNDEMADVRAGLGVGYIQMNGTRSHSNDYRDGNGNRVHSKYTRWSSNVAIGWTPGDDTLLELSGAKSDGKAAYADRLMDGARFTRDNIGMKFRQNHISPVLMNIEAQAYYNYIDHVMDNYSLRPFTPVPMSMPNPAASNPDRKTVGGKLMAGLAAGDATDARIGIDMQQNTHRNRMTANELTRPYEAMARSEDARFSNYGVFADVTHELTANDRLLAGMRIDQWHAEDRRRMVMSMMGSVMNPTYNQRRNELLSSGFGRYEHDLEGMPATLYIGIGHNKRFPDYWELISKAGTASVSAFNTRAEKTTQVDAGLTVNGDDVQLSLSGFYNRINDFNLIDASRLVMGMAVNRNINATTMGGEASMAYRPVRHWKVNGAISYVYGKNDSDGVALGQMPPLEGHLGLDYDDSTYSAGALLRMVATQGRFAANQGNIVGQDIGRTGGFAVTSLHAGWKPVRNLQITAGIDNLFDKVYAEHISRAGSTVAGYVSTTRVNEMGRSLWLSANLTY
ncbi:TonB-dependent copper receptor [Mariprofundus erugo]|uniref:TonB-dependent copper receptor n=1 Tax=Mariprofundus erugo TaxID=2528639 RepID=UPI0019310251|nr:TonB-dependent copper receptor [Mariprofundus erugo]